MKKPRTIEIPLLIICILLVMGIPSRYVTCMPKESEFDDCHVINAVFSKELNKWIWIDPTFAAYVVLE